MVGWQRTTPGKGERHGADARAKREAMCGIPTTAPIVDRRTELDHTTHAARRDMECRGVGHRDRCAAAQPSYGRRADCHVYRGHFERHSRQRWLCCGCELRWWPSRRGWRRGITATGEQTQADQDRHAYQSFFHEKHFFL